MELITNESIMSFTLRVILGVLFFMQGFDKVVKVKMPGVIQSFRYEFGKVKMPDFILVTSAYVSSFIELIAGFTLIIGLFTKYSLYLLGIDLILVTAAFSLINPVWDMKIVFPRIILWCALMVTPASYNKLAIDHFLK
ncbi:MAG: DoxX family protein [Bacteroidetes bacterium]|nr:DoxX family protein [Bacteroidota bacterium]